MELLTNSRMSTAKTCLRKAYFMYELGLRKDRDSTPLRMGGAIHVGLDALAKGASVDEAILKATTGYLLVPAWAEPSEWEVERETVARLLAGYAWYYANDQLDVVESELSFRLPLLNPETGAASRNFQVAGVIDRIVKLPDGRLAVFETKTTSDDLSSGSDYWSRLRLDQQISLYVIAARQLGYDVETVLYDVLRKPSIRPRKITKVEASDIRFSHTYYHEQTDSQTLAGETETAQLYGSRLLADIAERPDWYFQRKEIARLESDLEEFKVELWSQQKLLRECQIKGHWFRNSAACLHPYPCEFREICFNGLKPEKEIPPGYVKLTNVHQELERSSCNDHGTTNQAVAPSTAAATEPDAAFAGT